MKKRNICLILALALVMFMLLGCAKEYSMGTRSETGYKSSWMNLEFTLPEGMEMSPDSELFALMGVASQDQINPETQESIFEMLAINSENSNNISLLVQKMSKKYSEKQYYEAMQKQLKEDSFGVYKFGELTQTTLAKESFYTADTSVIMNGTTYLETFLFKVKGDRMIVITITYDTDTAKTQMLNAFSEYKG